jgi:diguanylate cyclase (GGDEF)-like protein
MTLDLSPADLHRLTTCPTTRLHVRPVGEILLERRRSAGTCAVILADLDGLKAVNDQLGHAAGDAVLLLAAEVIRATVRADDLVSRWGGDEFLVLLADTGDATDAAHRLAAALDGRWGVRASVGLGIGDADDAIRQADAAMYRAKRARR